MANPSLQSVTTDPNFKQLPPAEQSKVLLRLMPEDPNYKALPQPEKAKAIKKVLEMNPEYVKQQGQSPFTMVTGAPDIKSWGIPGMPLGMSLNDQMKQLEYAVKEFGGGLYDVAKGTLELVKPPETPTEKAIFLSGGGPAGVIGKRIIESTLNNLKQSMQVPGAVKDIVKSPYGAQAVESVLPRAAGQYVGSELIGKAGGKLMKAVAKRSMTPEEALSTKQAKVQSLVGAGPETTMEFAEKLRNEYEAETQAAAEANVKKFRDYTKASRKAREDQAQAEADTAKANKEREERIAKVNADKQAAYEEAKKKTDELNQAQAEQVGRRAELAKKVDTDSAQFGTDVKALENKVRLEGRALYKPIDDALVDENGAPETVPVHDVSDLVTHAEENILKGSSESIKQFREILQRAEDDAEPELKESETDPRKYAYAAGSQGMEDFTFNDLQGYSSELGKAMMRPGLAGDVYHALKYVRNGLKEQMYDMAERHDMGEQLTKADAFWKQYERTFHDMSPVKRGGSPVAHIQRAVDPGYILDPLLGKAGTRAISLIRKYDPALADRAGQLVKDYREMQELPKKIKVAESPEPPKLAEPPSPREPKQVKMPEKPEYVNAPVPKTIDELVDDLRQIKRKKVMAKSHIAEWNRWDAAAFGAGLVEIFRGELPKAWIYIISHYGVGKVLERPDLAGWLAEPTPQDMAILRTVYDKYPKGKPQAQAAITGTLTKWAREGKRVPLRPYAGFLTKPQLQYLAHLYMTLGAAQQGGQQTRPLSAPPPPIIVNTSPMPEQP